jgi:DNA polymerase/3'-5' exonuclease PolX
VSGGQGVSLLYAEIHAEDVTALIADVCERVEVAGSIRRKSELVHDIEIVATPKLDTSVVRDRLFEDTEVTTNLLLSRLDELVAEGRLRDHPTDPKRGERMAKLVDDQSGMQVDLFMVLPPAQFGVIQLIRTGSAGYSQWFVTECRRRGYHVVDGALHFGGLGCGSSPCSVVWTPDEKDVYATTGITFTPPHLRTAG